MSSLSARTYSCGGDGSLFGKGGEALSLEVATGFGAGLKYRFRPVGFDAMIFTISSSSLEGAEDSEELSEADMM